MKRKAIALLMLLAVSIAARADSEITVDDEYEDVPEATKAFVLVRRKISEERPAADKPVTVTIELFNGGDSAATGVKAVEEAWPTDRFETSGDLAASFETLAPGTSLSFSYTLTPKGKVSFVQRPTIVTYVAEEGGKQLSTSSPWLPFQSFTTQDLIVVKALELGSTATLGFLNTPTDWIRAAFVAGGLFALLAGSGLVKAVSAKRKTSQRKKAMKALGVDIKDE